MCKAYREYMSTVDRLSFFGLEIAKQRHICPLGVQHKQEASTNTRTRTKGGNGNSCLLALEKIHGADTNLFGHGIRRARQN